MLSSGESQGEKLSETMQERPDVVQEQLEYHESEHHEASNNTSS
jgi:hypothetical protein